MDIICQVCGKQKYYKPSVIKRGRGKYCSRPCAAIAHKENYRGENNPDWKGDQVKYRGIHMWIQNKLGKANKCSFDEAHEATGFHWANISGSYLRDLDDWMQLCPKCHKKYDMTRKGRGMFFATH